MHGEALLSDQEAVAMEVRVSREDGLDTLCWIVVVESCEIFVASEKLAEEVCVVTRSSVCGGE